jgi:hypothetical protein
MPSVSSVLFPLLAVWLAAFPALAQEADPGAAAPDAAGPSARLGLLRDQPPEASADGFGYEDHSNDRLQNAVNELQKELAAAQARHDTPRQAEILGSMGTLYMLMGRDDQSLDALYRGSALQQMLGNAEKVVELQILIDTVTARRAR